MQVRSFAAFVAVSILFTSATFATETIGITTPNSGSTFVPGSTVDISGQVGYTWGWDYCPTSIRVKVFDNNGFTYLDGTADNLNCSFGSGNWDDGDFTFSQWWAGGQYTFMAISQYYGNTLATATVTCPYNNPNGNNAPPPAAG